VAKRLNGSKCRLGGKGVDRVYGVVIVEGEEAVWGELWAAHCNQWELCCADVRERRALPKSL